MAWGALHPNISMVPPGRAKTASAGPAPGAVRGERDGEQQQLTNSLPEETEICNARRNGQRRSAIVGTAAAAQQIPAPVAAANLSASRSSAQLPAPIYTLLSSFKSPKAAAHTRRRVLERCRVAEASKDTSERGLQSKCLTLYLKKIENKQRCHNCC